MPPNVGIGEQSFPPGRASAHADPHQHGDKEKIGKRWNRNPRPWITEQVLDPDALFMRERLPSGNRLRRSHVLSYSPDDGRYFSESRLISDGRSPNHRARNRPGRIDGEQTTIVRLARGKHGGPPTSVLALSRESFPGRLNDGYGL